MSTNVYWKPVSKQENRVGDSQLKECLFDNFSSTSTILNRETLGFLSGLASAGVDGAQELIDAINKHGEIKVYVA